MREINAISMLLLLCGCAGGKAPQPVPRTGAVSAAPTRIQVVAHGLRSEQGRLRAALFAAKEGFPNDAEKSLQWGYATLRGSEGSMEFEPVAPGVYAVAVFHDEDGDGKLAKDWLGRPEEGWGVSRDAEGTFGPPSFADSAFEAQGDTMTVHVKMRY